MSKSLFTTIIEEIAPTTETVGVVGQLYLDTVEKKLYQCVAVTTETVDEVEVTSYQWSPIGVSQEEFNKVLSGETQLGGYNSFKAGSASEPSYGISIGADAKSNTHGIALGYKTIAGEAKGFDGVRNIAIGCSSGTTQSGINDTVSLGSHSHASATAAIQLGAGTNSKQKSVQIYNDNIYDADTHTATLQNIEQNGNPVYATLKGEIDPTSETVGSITQLYLNTITKTLFQCVNITSEVVEEVEIFTYEWKEIGSSSNSESGTGNVDLTGYATEEYVNTSISNLVDSAPDALNTLNELATAIQENDSVIDTLNSAITNKAEQTSLDAVINNEVQIGAGKDILLLGGANIPSNTTYPNILIGKGSSGEGGTGVAVGINTTVYNNAVAIGGGCYANHYAIAIGLQAKASGSDSIQLGYGTNSTNNTLQVKSDNIYNWNTHTLTVQNISLNGTDINTVITNALPTLTSQLTNDSGYLTAADLNNSSVTVGETETTMEEIATMATNSIQVEDAATTDDIDELFA